MAAEEDDGDKRGTKAKGSKSPSQTPKLHYKLGKNFQYKYTS